MLFRTHASLLLFMHSIIVIVIVIVVSKTKEENGHEYNFRYHTMLSVWPWLDTGYPVPQQ